MFFHRQMGQDFWFYRILVQYFVHEEGCLSGFYSANMMNPSQFIERLKDKPTSVGMNAPLFLFLAFLQQQKKDVVLKVVAQSFEK
jgi:hypothetical protein